MLRYLIMKSVIMTGLQTKEIYIVQLHCASFNYICVDTSVLVCAYFKKLFGRTKQVCGLPWERTHEPRWPNPLELFGASAAVRCCFWLQHTRIVLFRKIPLNVDAHDESLNTISPTKACLIFLK